MPKIADIEDTPNPNAVKFVLKDRIAWGAAKSYGSAAEAAGDELARKLFAIAHVSNVFYLDNWITVTQDGGADWPELVRKLAQPIREAPAAETPSEAAMRQHGVTKTRSNTCMGCSMTLYSPPRKRRPSGRLRDI